MRNTLYWLNQALAYWGLVFLLIPIKTLKKLFLYGLIGGFFYTWIVQYFAVNIFHRWSFHSDLISVFGIPVFFVLSWFGVTLIYGYLLLRFPKYQVGLVFLFALVATQLNYFGIQANVISMSGWNLFDTFMFGVFSHVLNLYLLRFMLKKNELGAPQP